jgi:antitoxin (DNA-binding transcriptional repressor) of toxin-antitoxin stability system
MNSNVKGAVAEQAIVLAATKLGVPVLRPVNEHGRTDLAFDFGSDMFRVQVKWGRLSPTGDVVIVSLRTARCTPRGHVFRTYTKDEVDLFAVYCGDLDRCLLLPAELLADRTVVYLRLTPARNGQRACINLADDFTFDGAVAQLARATRWQRVGQGFESPQLHSNSANAAVTIGAEVRGPLGQRLDRVAASEHRLVTRRGKPVNRLSGVAPGSAMLSDTLAPAPAEPPDTVSPAPPALPATVTPATAMPPDTVAGPPLATPEVAPGSP